MRKMADLGENPSGTMSLGFLSEKRRDGQRGYRAGPGGEHGTEMNLES